MPLRSKLLLTIGLLLLCISISPTATFAVLVTLLLAGINLLLAIFVIMAAVSMSRRKFGAPHN